MSGDDFLSRWSRRKRDAREEANEVPSVEPPVETPAEEEGPEITPEEIAALPAIEDLTPETDITGFLRKGVPELLKNAALRRIWSLDPAIRDYVSEAREYAYDWNVPGGVPGNGPLLPGDNVSDMLDNIFGDVGQRAAVAAGSDLRGAMPQHDETELRADASSQAKQPGETADVVQQDGSAAPVGDAPDASSSQALLQNASGGAAAVGHAAPQSIQEPHPAVPRRRHGGAIPL